MSGNERVWMHHDELGRTIPACRSQVPFMGDAGWYEVAPPPEPEPEPEPDREPETEDKPPAKAEKKPTLRRHSTKDTD